ncbi:MAG TPA: tryptophan-rich sensory protein [Oscillospiraceae bacterium]|nr:tryptophan-rich sensory protein [Oscillospiraceae bacterium]HPF56248.1 tryptophan-rich sensory protein [Clostridiales bacterium]HPK35959.1 tryptophan-rich sensory protein [Oscillospiraceae bacterium]HPR76667.1 tryptophan-rich sensory protein [Oscillospiraceae bacterium]
MKKMKDKTKISGLFKFLIALAFVGMVTVNALANILPLNGIGTGAVSDSYPNLFAPAGYTFAIWGLIYLLLALSTLYQLGLFRSSETEDIILMRKVGFMFAVSSLTNAAWIFAWHYNRIALSFILMVLLLLYLMDIVVNINAKALTTREKWFLRLPFSVYFGWITVATIANAATLLVSVSWDRFGLSEPAWTIIMLSVGALIGIITILRLKDVAYGLVLIWAYTGILVKHLSASGFNGQYPNVILTVIICLALFAAAVIFSTLTLKKKRNS